MKLYNVAYSGNSYKVRILLAHLGIPYEIIEVDIMKNPAASSGVSDRTDQTIAASCGELTQ